MGAHIDGGCDTPDECIREIAPTIAADLALAEKVRRLPNENLSIRHCPTDDEYEWCVAINAKGYKVGCGTTLTAAIEEALDDID